MTRTKFLVTLTFVVVILILCILFIINFISHPNPITTPSGNMSDDTRVLDETKIMNVMYTADYEFFKGVTFEQPHDVLLTEKGTILVADGAANCLYEFDMDGNLLETIGKTGNGMCEFSFPTALCELNGSIYVADNNNNRIQVLTSRSYDYRDQFAYELDMFGDGSNIVSIVSDGVDTIYVSGNYFFTGDAVFSKYSVDQSDSAYGERQNIAPLCGALTYNYAADILYLVDTYELQASQGSYRRTQGTHYLSYYDPETNDIETVFEFPAKYMPSEVFITDDGFIALSLTRETIDRFNESGQYIDTIYYAEEYKGMTYAVMADDGTLFVSCPYEGMVLRLTPTESVSDAETEAKTES